MSTKFKILSTISFIALAIVLTFVGVWALTDFDFVVGGNITYTAPASEVKDVSEYPTLQFYVTDSTAKTVSVQQNTSNKPTGELVIPSKVLSGGEEYSVTSINYLSSGTLLQLPSQTPERLPELRKPEPGVGTSVEGGFYGCTGLTSVVIPDTITDMGTKPFYNCNSLLSVVIGDGVTSIPDQAFYHSSGSMILESVEIGDGVASIGDYAFTACPIKSLKIGKSLASITASIFSLAKAEEIVVDSGNQTYDSRNNCNAIIETSTNTLIAGCKNTVIPSTVTSIGSYAFSGCTSLTSITIPESVTSIGSFAFHNCTGLTSITIPDSVTSIGNSAFFGCTGLTSITIPESVTSIGSFAFHNCTGLTSITIPDSVTSIGSSAFSGCTGLETIVVESGNTKYNSNNNCNAIIETSTNTLITGCKNTVIPSTVTSIGDYAFSNCTGLTSITIPDKVISIDGHAFWGCTGLTSITIPDKVTSIGSNVFYNCTGLTSVTIGSGVQSINKQAFYGCTKLATVNVKATSVPTGGDDMFYNCPLTTGILVPSASVSTYKGAIYWSDYSSKIYAGNF